MRVRFSPAVAVFLVEAENENSLVRYYRAPHSPGILRHVKTSVYLHCLHSSQDRAKCRCSPNSISSTSTPLETDFGSPQAMQAAAQCDRCTVTAPSRNLLLHRYLIHSCSHFHRSFRTLGSFVSFYMAHIYKVTERNTPIQAQPLTICRQRNWEKDVNMSLSCRCSTS